MIQGGITALFCLVCLGAITQGTATMKPMPSSASQTKLLQVEQSVISTTTHTNGLHGSKGETPLPLPPPPPRPRPQPMPLRPRPPPPPPPPVNMSWCVVKPSTTMEELDRTINYCCIQPGVDCSVIQPGGMCYFPPNKVSDASVVMNIFYKLYGEYPFDCYFNGSGLVVTQDPSVGECIYAA